MYIKLGTLLFDRLCVCKFKYFLYLMNDGLISGDISRVVRAVSRIDHVHDGNSEIHPEHVVHHEPEEDHDVQNTPACQLI